MTGRERLIAAGLAIGLLCLASSARADHYRGDGSLDMDLGHDVSSELEQSTVGLSLLGGFGVDLPVLYMAGLDYRIGVSRPLGALYNLNLSPIGFGIFSRHRARLSILEGIGFSGETDEIPIAGHFTTEARLDVALGERIRVEMAGKVREIFACERRENGSANAPFGDELELDARLRLGRSFRHSFVDSSKGYYIGVSYSERAGLESVGFRFGYSTDFSI